MDLTCAPFTTDWNDDPQSLFTVSAGVSIGTFE